MAAKHNVRAQAAQVIAAVIRGQSLTTALLTIPAGKDNGHEHALLMAMSYGVCRYWFRLDAIARQLLAKPLKTKDQDVYALILCGLYQLMEMRMPAHAAVSETVNATAVLNKPWSRKLVNALLRKFQRDSKDLLHNIEDNLEASSLHPQWLLDRFSKDWPAQAEAIISANNGRAPMSLRVNLARAGREAYMERLQQANIEASVIQHSEAGLQLQAPCDVGNLPGFIEGDVSVQDAAAQQAAVLLDAQAGERILDACAAPGGKTAHILERLAMENAEAEVVALDVDADRLQRVEANLERLGLRAIVIAGDGLSPENWWDGQQFHRILLDAPCSASGVIRRHPDIRLLRREADIGQLASEQAAMLETLWPLLAPGGRLLYATCSILKQENTDVVSAFLENHPDATELAIEADWGQACKAGRQVISGELDMDGFYYSLLQKGLS